MNPFTIRLATIVMMTAIIMPFAGCGLVPKIADNYADNPRPTQFPALAETPPPTPIPTAAPEPAQEPKEPCFNLEYTSDGKLTASIDAEDFEEKYEIDEEYSITVCPSPD